MSPLWQTLFGYVFIIYSLIFSVRYLITNRFRNNELHGCLRGDRIDVA